VCKNEGPRIKSVSNANCTRCGTFFHKECLNIPSWVRPVDRDSLTCSQCIASALERQNSHPAHPPSQESELFREELLAVATQILPNSLAPTSYSSYYSSISRVRELEKKANTVLLPMSKEGSLLYLAGLINTKLAWSTIEKNMCAVNAWHTSYDLPSPFTKRMKAGTRRMLGPQRSQQKLKLSLKHLRLILAHLSKSDTYANARDACWLVLAFFGFRRKSEIITDQHDTMGLRTEDVHLTPKGVVLNIRKAKNSQFSGFSVLICNNTKSGINIRSIVHRHMRYLFKAEAFGQGLPFIQSTDITGNPSGTRFDYARRFKTLLAEALGWSEVMLKDYATHSLRRGGTTHAWKSGVNLDLIIAHGRWTSNSWMLYRKLSSSAMISVSENM
jgi:hypothetical protein